METHSCLVGKQRYIWLSERLWGLSKNLPVKVIKIEAIKEFDQDCWFVDRNTPTCRKVAQHAKRIYEADLNYSIILAADGHLMDGGHRIAKAWLLGQTEINAVQFEQDPEPDWIENQ